ncbi:hypothetical protein ABPG74_010659 [Tetrahymena malaccensis]
MSYQKYKLNYTFQLWYDHFIPEQIGKDYEKSQIIVGEFDSIQSFWGLFNNIPKLNELSIGSSYHLMKQGIKPLWEDPLNSDGSISKLKIAQKFDEIWIETIVLWISNEFKDNYEEEFINGISITKKQSDLYILQIWQNNKEEPEEFYETWKKCIKQNTQVTDIPSLNFKLCFDSIRGLRRKGAQQKPTRSNQSAQQPITLNQNND